MMFVFVFLIVAGRGYSQAAVQSGDTLRIRQQQREQQKEQQQVQQRDQQPQAAGGNANGQVNGRAGKAVKQVMGNRPDMSKAKGARPPMIVRPSGSGVPKGVGKPGGAGRRGGR